jgi:hypothetical protein
MLEFSKVIITNTAEQVEVQVGNALQTRLFRVVWLFVTAVDQHSFQAEQFHCSKLKVPKS